MLVREVNMAESQLFDKVVTWPQQLWAHFCQTNFLSQTQITGYNHHHWAIAPKHTFLETLLTPTQGDISQP
jgi:hypothetical protein